MYKEYRNSCCYEIKGKKLFAMLHKPELINCQRAIVFCHGFGGNKIGANRFFVSLSQAFAKQGIASIRFDLRGCGDSEGEFQDITINSQIEDLTHVLNLVKQDFNSIGLLGVSLGSTISLLSAPQCEQVKSIALFAPLSSHDMWQKEWEYAQKHLPDVPYLSYKGRVVNRTFFEEFFSINFSSSVRNISYLPLLHVHGDKDTIVPIGHKELFKEWRKNSVSATKFIDLPQSDHSFSNVSEQDLIINNTVNWFLGTL
jgi:pimeloyl-ACP methyl ester carboxylesterase